MEQKADIEQLLKDGNTIWTMPNGYSMYPMLVPGRDSVVIEPYDGEGVRRGEVILYRRDGSILVLHRVWKVGRDGLYMVGDNQTQIEGPLRTDQVRGRLVSFTRKGRQYAVDYLPYRFYASLWLLLRPVRHKIAVAIHFVKTRLKFRSDTDGK